MSTLDKKLRDISFVFAPRVVLPVKFVKSQGLQRERERGGRRGRKGEGEGGKRERVLYTCCMLAVTVKAIFLQYTKRVWQWCVSVFLSLSVCVCVC